MASTRHLPLDIIHTILLNLPVKSLLIFKTVCKSWNAIISDRRFAKVHHQNLKNSDSHNLFLMKRRWGREVSLVKFENKNLYVKEVLQDPVLEPYSTVVCSCNGLVLLKTPSDDKCVLWNPSTRKHAIIRSSSWCDSCYETNYGLCHDPNTDDYKIIVICREYYDVFSCNNKTWIKKPKDTNSILESYSPPLFVNGFTFWSVWNPRHRTEIIYFDHRDDKFKKLQEPKPLESSGRLFFAQILRGRLCLYNNIKRGLVLRLRFWLLEGHVDSCNWSEVTIIDYTRRVDEIGRAISIWPICFTEKNEIVVMKCSGHSSDAFVYSPLRKTLEKYNGLEDFGYGTFTPYLGSLFLPIQTEKE